MRLVALANTTTRIAKNGSTGRVRLPRTTWRIGQPSPRTIAAIAKRATTSVAGGVRVGALLAARASCPSQAAAAPPSTRARISGVLVRRTALSSRLRRRSAGSGTPEGSRNRPIAAMRQAVAGRGLMRGARLRFGSAPPSESMPPSTAPASIGAFAFGIATAGRSETGRLSLESHCGPRRQLLQVLEDLGELVLVERLLLEERRGEPVEHRAVLDDQLVRLVVRVLDEGAHLLVDLLERARRSSRGRGPCRGRGTSRRTRRRA